MADEVKIGDRVAVYDDIATVKYIGPVSSTQGEWIGVEWDDPKRGKHDGSKDNVRYFTCRYETSGSFLRRQKLNHGISICAAIKDRYTVNKSDAGTDAPEIYFGKKVETVGMEKMQNRLGKLDELWNLGLRQQNISSVGLPSELKNLIPNAKDINLSRNLLSSWNDAFDILQQLSNLKTINLSENIMSLSPEITAEPNTSIKTAILNKCQLNWDQVVDISQIWPNVEQIFMESNCISDMKRPAPLIFANLESLSLNGNKLSSFSNCKKAINHLTNLKTLYLNNCGLCKLSIEEGDLPHLATLSISENNFETYQVFNELNKLEALTEVFFRKNPLCDSEDYNIMFGVIVAKVGKLQRFNRIQVDDDRVSCELDYLKKYGPEWRKSGGHHDPEKNNPSEQFAHDHPRYSELTAKYGALEDHQIFKKTTALKGNLIEVTIVDAMNANFKPISRKLPLSMTIANLRMLLQKVTKVGMQERRLVYASKSNPKLQVAMERDSETLHDVSIEPGDTIKMVAPVATDYESLMRRLQTEIRAYRVQKDGDS